MLLNCDRFECQSGIETGSKTKLQDTARNCKILLILLNYYALVGGVLSRLGLLLLILPLHTTWNWPSWECAKFRLVYWKNCIFCFYLLCLALSPAFSGIKIKSNPYVNLENKLPSSQTSSKSDQPFIKHLNV